MSGYKCTFEVHNTCIATHNYNPITSMKHTTTVHVVAILKYCFCFLQERLSKLVDVAYVDYINGDPDVRISFSIIHFLLTCLELSKASLTKVAE